MPINNYGTRRGWFRKPVEHGLASKGIKTSVKGNPDKRNEFIPDVETPTIPNEFMMEFESVVDEVPHTETQKMETNTKLQRFKEGAKKFGSKASELAHELHDIVTEKHEKERQSKALIETFGSKKEQKELEKEHEDIDPVLLSDHTLKEMAIRFKEGIFGGNPFKEELIRRERARSHLEEDLSRNRIELRSKMKEFQKEVKKKEPDTNIFGF